MADDIVRSYRPDKPTRRICVENKGSLQVSIDNIKKKCTRKQRWSYKIIYHSTERSINLLWFASKRQHTKGESGRVATGL